MTQQLDRNKAYIQDILNAIQLCGIFIQSMTFEQFEKDLKTVSAVQHQILIIGEATKRLSTEFRNQHSNIPWKAMAGMRDILIHSYENADLGEIWKTIRDVMPKIAINLSKI
jgi:uncharacterized protein with HEPN domain